MAHYAFLDENNIVIEVIVGKEENEDGVDWEQHYGNFRGKPCKRTSYNTIGGVHLKGGIPFRKNYAGIGFKYDEIRDAFIPPQPFSSWRLIEETANWQSPLGSPPELTEEQINSGSFYKWDEYLHYTDNTQGWVLQIP